MPKKTKIQADNAILNRINGFESYLIENTTLQPSTIIQYVNEVKNYFKHHPRLNMGLLRKHILRLNRMSHNIGSRYAFKHFLRYCEVEPKYIDLIPKVRLPAKKKFSQFPDAGVVVQVLRHMPNNHYLDIAKLQVATGCRSMEIITLRKENINMINLRALIMGKGNKTGYVQFKSIHKPILEKYYDNKKGFLFLDEKLESAFKNDPMKFLRQAKKFRDLYYQVVRRAAVNAGITGFGTHSLRRAFSLEFYKCMPDLRALKEALRHSNITTTMTYLPEHTEEVKDVIKLVQDKFSLEDSKDERQG